MENNYLILLPTSESKSRNENKSKPYRMVKNLKEDNSFISLNNQRDYILEELELVISNSKNEIELSKIFDLKGKKLQESIEIISDLLNEGTIPAIERFNGIMFQEIKYSKMNEEKKKNFDNSILFIDGFFGILKPLDLIPEYKLKLNSKIRDINLIEYWKENLKSIFKVLFENKLIIDVLPENHKKIINFEKLDNYVTIKFCEIKNNKLINLGHNSKKLKGELINYLISFKNLNLEEIKKFKHSEGFSYNEEYSSKNEFIYTK